MELNRIRVISGVNVSLLTPKEQEGLYALLKKYGVFLFRITGHQRLEVFDVTDEEFTVLQSAIHTALDKTEPQRTDKCYEVTYVKSCPGEEQCRYAIADALRLGRKLDSMRFNEPFPHKVKISIAGCSMCCTEPYLRDVGIIATKKGWSISFGGNGGSRPRIGDLLAQRLAEEEVVNQVKKALIFYCQKANRKERTARFIERFGIDRFKTEITK